MGMAGAALASAVSAILTLLLRTFVGEKYFKVLESWRCLWTTIGLMTIASFGNLYLTGVIKYLFLMLVLAASCWLYRAEIRTLWQTARQLAAMIVQKLRKR